MDPWERRVRRARELEREWPFAGEILSFYRRIAALQGDAARSASGTPGDFPFGRLAPFVDPLLDLVVSTGPEVLAREASHLLELAPEARRARVLPGGPGRWWTRSDEGLSFFTIVLLQPYLATIMLERAREDSSPATCPFCGAGALTGLMREDPSASSRRRTLQCSLCSREWECARVLCPACGEQRPEKLPRYEAEEIPGIRVDACDSCSRYLKTIDLSKRPAAEPVVDELASTPLDVIAREKGYAKAVQNFAGL